MLIAQKIMLHREQQFRPARIQACLLSELREHLGCFGSVFGLMNGKTSQGHHNDFRFWIFILYCSEEHVRIRGLLSSILHLRFFIPEGAPHALWREQRLANADPDSAVYSVNNVHRHRIERGLAAAFGAIKTDAILVL